jgi:hypothetical protein
MEEILREIEEESRTTTYVQEALVSGISGEGAEQLANPLPILRLEERLVSVPWRQAAMKLDICLLRRGKFQPRLLILAIKGR